MNGPLHPCLPSKRVVALAASQLRNASVVAALQAAVAFDRKTQHFNPNVHPVTPERAHTLSLSLSLTLRAAGKRRNFSRSRGRRWPVALEEWSRGIPLSCAVPESGSWKPRHCQPQPTCQRRGLSEAAVAVAPCLQTPDQNVLP